MSPSAEPTSQAEAPAHLVPANLLGDDEIIILALKPSGWFVLTASLPVLAAAGVVAVAGYLLGRYRPYAAEQAVLPLCAAVALGRLVVACWQWVGRTYVLTNLRVISVRGLLRVEVAAAALGQVARAEAVPSLAERLVGIGSIYCLPGDQAAQAVSWNAVARPQEVLEIVSEAVRRARRPGQGRL